MFLLIPYRSLSHSHRLIHFTFQYVSINTFSGFQDIAFLSNFTFQYVSINTGQERWKRSPSKTFTFQYVSINTDVDFQNGEVIVFFTFQYVSINTLFGFERFIENTSLHSNMFLLILLGFFASISTVMYFTFQYVSINTLSGRDLYPGSGSFTFQYVSINTTRFHRRNSFRNPLHSNMFLLILFALLFCCLSYLSLHSNMFLLIPCQR